MAYKMGEQEILDSFENALRCDYIFAQYQPQIDHCTRRLVGAEALMRWKDPVHGVQYPSDFIPVLEAHNLIHDADLHIFELICRFQQERLAKQLPTVPISFNVSRHDIYNHNYVDAMEEIRIRYDVPVSYLRVELTESSAIGGLELVRNVIEKLHEYGYIVEMDDFGCGYSSLNFLKDLNVDIIKLDMKFLDGDIGGRGGIIISSVVQMAKWLETPVLAEGVETVEQADFMLSIGCKYIQGYLYSKPLFEEDFKQCIMKLQQEPLQPAMDLIDTMNAGRFWNPKSLETLIFSNFVGAAAIFTYEDEKIELLRVNEKYIREMGMNLTQEQFISLNPWTCFDEENKKIYLDMIKRAIASGEEESCETWRDFYSECCGNDSICIRSFVRVIGTAGRQFLFYTMVQNITAEKKNFEILYNSERRFRFASEQAKMYAWEYHVATRQMRPCFRCMRDLNLPPVLENYPEPVIRSGLFPAECADLYRDWHRQIANGAKELEAIMHLTNDRIPFHVRYTTEFDATGKPLKAYGSATLVVDSI